MSEPHGLSSISDAFEVIRREIRPLEVVQIALADACGLTLAEPVATDIDSPPFDKAMMDGFALRSTDLTGRPTALRVVGEIAAGQMSATTLAPGEAMRINTGAPMPAGADAVVMIERVELSADGREVRTSEQLAAGASVSPRASDARVGQVILDAGTRLGPPQVASAAAAGAASVRVYRRPRLAVLVTGDELVDVGQRPLGGQIRNSNGPCLSALARRAGCETIDLGVGRDDPAILAERVKAGLGADVLCLSGGISMGQHDYVPRILSEAGVRLMVQKIAIKPGKPTLFGVGPTGQLVFGLPGNPTSAFVCFVVFVRAALDALQGRPVGWPAMIPAALESELKPSGARAEFTPAWAAHVGGGSWRAGPTAWTGSGDVFGLGRSNALIYREAGAAASRVGDKVAIALHDWVL